MSVPDSIHWLKTPWWSRARYAIPLIIGLLLVVAVALSTLQRRAWTEEASAKDTTLETLHAALEGLQQSESDARSQLVATLHRSDPAYMAEAIGRLNDRERPMSEALHQQLKLASAKTGWKEWGQLQHLWRQYHDARHRVKELVEAGNLEAAIALDSKEVQLAFAQAQQSLSSAIARLHVAQEGAHWQYDRYSLEQYTLTASVLGVLTFLSLLLTALFLSSLRYFRQSQRHMMQCMREAILVLDEQGGIADLNQVAQREFGENGRPLRGIRLQAVLPELGSSLVQEGMQRALRTKESVEINVLGLQLQRGLVQYELMIYPFQTGLTLVFRDITVRLRTQSQLRKQAEALRESEERFSLAIQGAADGIWDISLLDETAYFSPRWRLMLGLSDENAGRPVEMDFWLSRVHPDDVPGLQAALGAHVEGLSQQFEHEYRISHTSGGWRWMLARGAAVRGPDGRATRIAGSQTDITIRKETEEQLIHTVLHDGLTGLPNRTLFLERLRQCIEHGHRRKDYGFAVLFLDVDRFKVINDSLGHLEGDQLLVEVGQRVAGILRSADTLARLGGDEFTVLIDDVTCLEDAARVASRIQAVLEGPFRVGEQDVVVSLSIGIALSGDHYQRAEEVLRDADIALYQAKSKGRGRYECFDAKMHTLAVWRLQMEADLRRALEREELRVYYQPIVSLSTGRLEGMEALVRWPHPERGFISPLDFIPMAEETGLIVQLGEWVLVQACRQMCEWVREIPEMERLWVSVNLSSRQFVQPDFLERVEHVVRQSGIAPHQLKLELTESAAMENAERACQVLNQLCCLGVKVAIDDFGTGYSSLSYLHRFPATTLKIDRSFVERLEYDTEKYEIVRTIISLAENLGMTVVAEGIENEEQANRLQLLNCQQGQGYLFARPQDGEAIRHLIRNGTLQVVEEEGEGGEARGPRPLLPAQASVSGWQPADASSASDESSAADIPFPLKGDWGTRDAHSTHAQTDITASNQSTHHANGTHSERPHGARQSSLPVASLGSPLH